MRILLVEDHPALREMVTAYLVRRGFAVDTVSKAEAACVALDATNYDAMVLDLAAIDLGRQVREAAAAVLPIVERAGPTIEVEAPHEAVPVRGRAEDLRDMVRNFLDNSLSHGSGGITVRLRQDGGTALLEIGDEGSGIPEHLREAVFERFRKGRTGSPGGRPGACHRPPCRTYPWR
jgi:signal transduction histidine kinase